MALVPKALPQGVPIDPGPVADAVLIHQIERGTVLGRQGRRVLAGKVQPSVGGGGDVFTNQIL